MRRAHASLGHAVLALSAAGLAVALATCGGEASCTSSADCAEGRACVEGLCVSRPDAGAGIDAASCPAGTVGCAGGCVDLMTDRSSCGTCGRACGAAQVCVMGACAGECAPTETRCGVDCADLATSTAHCLACGAACAPGEVCAAAGCCAPSDPPIEVCDGRDNDCDGTIDFAACELALVAWYRFDETDGPVIDSSGHDNHGVLMGSATRGMAGRDGYALYVDGAPESFVEVADSGSLRFGTTYTAEAWIAPADCVHGTSGHNTVAAIEGELLLAFQNTCDIANYVNDGTSWVGDFPGVLVPTGGFVHYAATWDGATIVSYLNGNPASTGTAFAGAMPDTGRRLAIGARPDCCEQTFRGLIDDLRFYAAVRSHAQICADAGGVMRDGVCAFD